MKLTKRADVMNPPFARPFLRRLVGLAALQALFLGALCVGCDAARPQRSQLMSRRRVNLLALRQDAAAGAASDGGDGLAAGLSEEEARIVQWLASEEMGQGHLFVGWEAASPDDKRRLLRQVLEMDAAYPEDASGTSGLEAYVAHARTLLAESAADKNPFEGYTVAVPEGERMVIGSAAFRADEVRGAAKLQDCVFVLVAGGLGERLGFSGIKVALPAETLSGATFLQTYCEAIRVIGESGDGARPVPLVIMTSADTHALTVAHLTEANHYGLDPTQIHFITQANVPALQARWHSCTPSTAR